MSYQAVEIPPNGEFKMLKAIKWTIETVIEMGKCYIGMPNSVYHAQDGISKSSLDRFADSPYKYFYGKPMNQTRAMIIGSAIHSAILEPNLFPFEYTLKPDYSHCLSTDADMKAWLKSRGQAGYSAMKKPELIEFIGRCDETVKFKFQEEAAFVSMHPNVEILNETEMEKIEGMQKAVFGNKGANKYLAAEGFTEISFFTTDPITGIKIRIRFDKLAFIDGQWYGFDLKKTQSIKWRDTSNTLAKYRYHVQAAFYSYVFKLVTGIELAGFIFGFVEEEFPHVVAVGPLDDLSFNIGCEVFRADLNLYAEYERGDIVAHNDEEEIIFSLPDYVLREFEQEII